MNKFRQPVPGWRKESVMQRLSRCRSMLYLHGMLTDAENDKVHAKMIRQMQKAAEGKSELQK